MSETVDRRRLTELRSLLQVIEDAGWEYARVEIDGVALVVSSDPEFVGANTPPASSAPTQPGPPTPTAAVEAMTPEPPATAIAATPPPPAAPAPAEGVPPSGPVDTVESPTIGLFWRSPKPGAPPFVDVGDTVKAGETVCIIEVMKLMTHVTAPVDGIVRAIRIENGAMVEHGTPLIDIEPTGAGR